VQELTGQYAFSFRPVNDGSPVVYSEPAPQGNAVITRRLPGDAETQLNLELLFNYITSRKEV
jgi:ABC-2 type transport system ATP-binding protein